MTRYVLNYFDGYGRGEIIRLIFAISNILYTDNRIKLEDWSEVKPTTLLGTLPYLEINDTFILPQSQAIIRYLGREANLYGNNNLEKAKIDAFLDTVADAMTSFFSQMRLAATLKEREDISNKYAPGYLQNLEKLVKLWGDKDGFAVGNSITIADIAIFHFASFNPTIQSITDTLPGVKKIVINVSQNSRIAAYVKSRPKTPW